MEVRRCRDGFQVTGSCGKRRIMVMDASSQQEFPGNSDDAQIDLARRLRAGHRAAFSDMLKLYQRPLYAVIWRMLRNHEDTHDVLQETYLRVYQHHGRLDPDKPIFPYVRKIAINLSLNKIKSLKRQVPLEQAGMQQNDVDTELHVERRETLALVRRAIEELPREQQLVLTLRIQNGMSYQEIADALELRLGTVMSRLARAREKIAQYVKLQNKSLKPELLPL